MDNQNMDSNRNNKKSIISEPDENGVRYYTIGQPPADRPPAGPFYTDRQPDSGTLLTEANLEDVAASQLDAPDARKEPPEAGSAGMDFNDQNAQEDPKGSRQAGSSRASEGPGMGSGFEVPPRGSGMPPGGGGMPPIGQKKSLKKPLIIFGCILLAVILLGAACSSLTSDKESKFADISEDHISVLYIDGTIGASDESAYSANTYDHKWTLERLDDAIHNPNNKGLILFVNTPGGSVYETDEIYLKLQEYKATGRPLYSAMGSMAASGGYYISAPADKIIANRNCWTGSIGVTIGTLFDISELLGRYGIKTVTITSGKNKAMGGMTDPMTKEQQQIFQSLVDEAYEQFVGIVADGRSMPVKQVKKLADGRIYTAKQAQENGLIDQIGTLQEAIADMRAQYGLGDCGIYDMKYENSNLLSSLFSKVAQAADQGKKSDVAALLELMEQQGNMPISYMAQIGN